MRRRLLLVLLPLLTMLLVALEVPLAQMYAAGETQDLFIEHLADAQRYTARVEPFLRDKRQRDAVPHALRTYADVRGVSATVFDTEGTPALHVGSRPTSPASRSAVAHVLVDRKSQRAKTAWPWRKAPMVVGAPIGTRGTEAGVLVLEVPTASVRDDVAVHIAKLAGAGLGVLLLTSALCALPLARWILRPVHDLNATADRLALGGLSARASQRGGPPELRGLARAFNEMADHLVAALERQRAFVADASHELRNPLATLRLRIEALAGNVHGDGERDLQLALDESDRLAKVVARLLELARAEATEAERIDFEVVSTTQRRLAAWEPALTATGSTLQLQVPTRAVVRSSPDAFEHALDVLLDNALKFAPGGRVDVAIATREDRVEVSVRDDGLGLSLPELDQVGERFWRSASHRGIPGTGLGLATARVLLEAAGATLQVSRASPGFAVVLGLPRATAAPVDTRPARPGAGRADRRRSPSEY